MLKSEAKTRVPPRISWAEHTAIGRLCLIEEEQDLQTATSILHNLGSLVHFPNDDKVCPSNQQSIVNIRILIIMTNDLDCCS